MADNDEALEGFEDEAAEQEATGTDSEVAEEAATAEAEPEDSDTSDSEEGEPEVTEDDALQQIAALAARIDGIAEEIAEIRRWFKMSTNTTDEEEGPNDLSFDALADVTCACLERLAEPLRHADPRWRERIGRELEELEETCATR